MDDLNSLKGIGPATTKKLRAAGIDSFAKLAAATPDQLNAAQIAGGQKEWEAMIAEAKTKVPTGPLDINAATPEQIAERATLIEGTRQKLADLAKMVVSAYQVRIAMGPDATQTELDNALAAENLLRTQIDVIADEARQLLGVPEGEPLPAALAEELAVLADLETKEIPAGSPDGTTGAEMPAASFAGPEAGAGTTSETPASPAVVVSAPETNTTSESDGIGEAGKLAGLPAADIDRLVALEVARVGNAARELAQGDIETALAQLSLARLGTSVVVQIAQRVDAELAVIELELTRTETVWPLTVIRYDGADRPIGEPLKVDRVTFLALTSSKAAADHPPENDDQAE